MRYVVAASLGLVGLLNASLPTDPNLQGLLSAEEIQAIEQEAERIEEGKDVKAPESTQEANPQTPDYAKELADEREKSEIKKATSTSTAPKYYRRHTQNKPKDSITFSPGRRITGQ